jgi:GNAT superfamily N-acetyltransferase
MISLRFAGADDASRIYHFICALAEYEREPKAVQVTEAQLRAQLSASAPPFECLLADWNGESAGFALFFPTYSTWLGKPGLWLEDLFVLPEHRRHGVGRALLRRLGELAYERNCGRLEWSVLDWNDLAIGFYRSLGARLMAEWRICRVEGAALAGFAAPNQAKE